MAFPCPDTVDSNGCGIREGSAGMSLRDWFAGQAIGNLIQVFEASVQSGDYRITNEGMAHYVYTIADAMLAARAKEPEA